jgi:hypothetical protein
MLAQLDNVTPSHFVPMISQVYQISNWIYLWLLVGLEGGYELSKGKEGKESYHMWAPGPQVRETTLN